MENYDQYSRRCMAYSIYSFSLLVIWIVVEVMSGS